MSLSTMSFVEYIYTVRGIQVEILCVLSCMKY